MRMKFVVALLLAVCVTHRLPANYSIDPQTVKPYYNFANIEPYTLLDLFYAAYQQGRNYPTDAEFEAAGISLMDLAFVRSHVRRANIIDDDAPLNTNLYAKRQLFMNLPTGNNPHGATNDDKLYNGYPNGNFGEDVFSMWNYTQLYGAWAHLWFKVPGSWVDAAHKNGTDMLSGLFWYDDTASDGDQTKWINTLSQKNTDGTYKYVEPFLNILMYFGQDGINHNWEGSGARYNDSNVTAFYKQLYKTAYARGFNSFHAAFYAWGASGDGYGYELYSGNCNAVFGNSEGRTGEFMTNYVGANFSGQNYLTNSAKYALESSGMGTTEGLYAGAHISTMSHSWSYLNNNDYVKKMGVCLWGEHGCSQILNNTAGDDDVTFEKNYQTLLERMFSGGNRNPANRPTATNSPSGWGTESGLSNFQGLAEYIPERSAIQGNLPFTTHFCLGNGRYYYYHGKKTAGSWYNMSAQDYVPTYRWLVYQAGSETTSDAVQPEFTHDDAYIGGSCLRLNGTIDAWTDIVLYKTQLQATSGNPVANIAVKTGKEGKNPSNLYVQLRYNGTWYEFAVGDVAGPDWQEKVIPLKGIGTTGTIDRIGLRVKGQANGILVGKLAISDDRTAEPASLKDLVVEAKEPGANAFTAKMRWQVSKTGGEREAYGMLFNDEANIDHFEILYKDGADGKVAEVGRTSSWAALIPNLPIGTDTYIGVRAASVDGKSYSQVLWQKVDVTATGGDDGSTGGDDKTPPTYGTSKLGTTGQYSEASKLAQTRAIRWLKSATTTGASEQNLDWTGSQVGGDNYFHVNDDSQILKVKAGDKITITLVGNSDSYDGYDGSSEGLQQCWLKGYADYNINGTFDTSSEVAFEEGTLYSSTKDLITGLTKTFTVPATAKAGLSRLRIVFSDAWAAHPGPTGNTVYGYTIDFDMMVTNDGANEDDGTLQLDIADEPARIHDANPSAALPALSIAEAGKLIAPTTAQAGETMSIPLSVSGSAVNATVTLPNSYFTASPGTSFEEVIDPVLDLTLSSNIPDGIYTLTYNVTRMADENAVWRTVENGTCEASIIVGDLSKLTALPALKGYYTAEVAEQLNARLANNKVITYIDLAAAYGVDAIIKSDNPNMLLYIPAPVVARSVAATATAAATTAASIANEPNVVVGSESALLQLTDGEYPFYAPRAFTANTVTYTRSGLNAGGWYSICLPFDVPALPADCRVEKYTQLDKDKMIVTFTPVEAMKANVPYIFRASAAQHTFDSQRFYVIATPNDLTDGAFTGTYLPLLPGSLTGNYALRGDGSGFGICNASTYMYPFRAYLNATELGSMVTLVHADTPTGINAAQHDALRIQVGGQQVTLTAGDADCHVNVFAADGRSYASLNLKAGLSHTLSLAPGIYVINNRKVIIK